MQSGGGDGKPQAERLDHPHGWVALLRVLITESMVTYREVFIDSLLLQGLAWHRHGGCFQTVETSEVYS